MSDNARQKAKKNGNRVKAKDRAFHQSIQKNYKRGKTKKEAIEEANQKLL